MHARNWLIALLLTATLAAGVFAVRGHKAQPERAPANGDQAPSAAASAANQEREPSRQAPRPDRGAIPIDDPSGAAGEFVEVDIVSADTRAPLSKASVWYWPKRTVVDGEQGFESWLRMDSLEEHLDEAVVSHSDARGRVRVPGSALGFHIAASLGELWGAATFGPRPEPPAIVALGPDLDLRMRVVDAQGAFVGGVPVALRQRRAGWLFDALTSRTRPDDGMAILRHAQRFLTADSKSSGEYVLAVRGLFDPPLEGALDGARDSAEPLTLVLPPSGSCEVVVVDAADRGVRGPMEVRLSFSDSGESGVAPVWYEHRASRSADSVVFEHVALGRGLAALVFREGSNSTLEAHGLGPRTAGERVTLRVPLGASAVSLRGRLVDGAGNLVAGASARAQFESNDPLVRFDTSWPVVTQVDGGFSVDVAQVAEVQSGAVLAIHQTSAEGAELAVARRPVPRDLAAGAYELGDFVLVETPIAAAGLVIDADGAPVAGASVIPIPASNPASEDAERPVHESWLRPCRSDDRGRFEIRCERAAGKLVLAAEKDGLVGDPQLVNSGDRGVRLVVRPAAAIEGRVLLDSSLLGAMVLVEASRKESEPASLPSQSGTSAVIAADGGFKIEGLRGGTHSIRVIYAATGSELGRVEDCTLRTGVATRDPRLDPLDLRESFRLLALEPIDEHGAAIRGARAWSRASGAPDAPWTFAPPEAGRLMILSDGHPVDVAVSAAGYLRTVFESVSTSQRLTLRRAYPVRLQLAGGLRVPDPPLFLGVELIPIDAGPFPGFADGGVRYFDERGELAGPCGFAGRVRVELSLARRERGVQASESLAEGQPQIISIAEQGGEQVFEVSCSPAKLEAAAKALRGEN